MNILPSVEGISGPGALVYDCFISRSPFAVRLYREFAKEVLSIVSSGAVLDVGTGPGYLALEIAKRSVDLHVTGLDLSHSMVNVALKNARDNGLSDRVGFRVGDVAKLPFEEASFDLVVSTFSLHHWSKPVESFNEIHRVLRPDCKALIYDLTRNVTKAQRRASRKKHGRIMEFTMSRLVRIHSSISSDTVQGIFSSSVVPFSESTVENEGVILRIMLVK